MRRTLEIYRSIAEQSPNAILVTNTEGGIIYQNPAARKAFGFDDDEIFEQLVHDKIHHHAPDGHPVPPDQCKVYRAAAYGEIAEHFVWMVFRRDGSAFYASCKASPLYFENERIGALFIAEDITARKTAEDELYKSNEQLKLATEAADLGLFDHNLVTDELIWSDKTKEHFGLPPDARVTSLEDALSQIHPDDRDRVLRILTEASAPGSDGRYEFDCRTIDRRDGKERWLVTRGRWVFGSDGTPVRRIGVSVDVTDRKLAEQQLLAASQHDALTGLPNRSLLFEYCSHLIAMAKRAGAGGGAVLFIDLDRFKPINDLYGHDVGDKVLREVARRLGVCTRQEDLLCRLGGDEFVVVLPRVDTTYGPVTVAEHILESIGKPIRVDGLELSVSPSIGISLFPAHSNDLEALIRYADLAMYASKKAGKNTFTIYTQGMNQQTNQRLRLEMRLKEALASNSMALVYQPVIDMRTSHPVGVEALVRLPDEDGTLLSPREFIPIAESAGLIDKLGEWIVVEACKQHQRWRDAGLPPFSISINISPVQFRHRAFASQIAAAIEQSGIDPTCVHIEVPESAVMENIPEAIATLNAIKSLGVSVALDDFGIGYSSLSYLSSLPLDKPKIDKTFTRCIFSDASKRSLADGLIALGRSLNLQVVGEGIESEREMDYLKQHGCDQAQGFLFSPPLPPTELESWYREQHQLYQ